MTTVCKQAHGVGLSAAASSAPDCDMHFTTLATVVAAAVNLACSSGTTGTGWVAADVLHLSSGQAY